LSRRRSNKYSNLSHQNPQPTRTPIPATKTRQTRSYGVTDAYPGNIEGPQTENGEYLTRFSAYGGPYVCSKKGGAPPSFIRWCVRCVRLVLWLG
jgi:hypothetical protein